jgi:hypothetical protein
MPVAERRETSAVLRRRDLIDLFDTAPDLSGTHVDIAPISEPTTSGLSVCSSGHSVRLPPPRSSASPLRVAMSWSASRSHL